MKRIIAASILILVATMQPVQTAHADATCTTIGEFNNVDLGMTKAHVQQDIFDGYEGWIFWTDEDANWNYQFKDYDRCSADGLFQIEYRLSKDDPNGWRVIETNIYTPGSVAGTSKIWSRHNQWLHGKAAHVEAVHQRDMHRGV